MPGRSRASGIPLSDEDALELLARLRRSHDELGTAVWDCAERLHAAGLPVEGIAGAVGMSVRSFYRRLNDTRQD